MAKQEVISIEDFETICGMKSSYTGYVFDKQNCDLFHVDTVNNVKVSSSPSYPNEGDMGHSYNTKFFEMYGKRVTITLEEIGNNDVVYDEKGNFVEIKNCNDKERKGQIYIRKETYHKYIFDHNIPNNEPLKKHPGYEDIRIQDLKEMLQASAYSKIFTHIVSLMTGDKLKRVRTGKVSVVIHPIKTGIKAPKGKYRYNIKFQNEIPNTRTHAYFRNSSLGNDEMLTAVLYEDNSSDFHIDNKEQYSTLWNILNLLVGHEFEGHGEQGYKDEKRTYEYQMRHRSWDNTTEPFKKETRVRYEEQKYR